MEQYLLDKLNNKLGLYKYNEEKGQYFLDKEYSEEEFFNQINYEMDYKNQTKEKKYIEEMHYNSKALKIKTITFNKNNTYNEEIKIINITKRLMDDENFYLKFAKTFTKFNVEKNAIIDFICKYKYNSKIVKKRLMNIS